MVYLDVYNSIFEHLEDVGIIDEVFDHAEEVMKHLFDKIKDEDIFNDVVAEFSLFNYMYNGQLLIDSLSKDFYPYLNKNEKKEFDLIKESKRFNLKFRKKEKLNKLDTKRKELYDFYFHDIDNDETKIIVSSTALDELKHILNARLIKNPNHNGKFSIIGGIFDKKTFEAVSSLSELRFTKEKFEKIESYVVYILELSKGYNLEEIDNYKNDESAFLEQDKQIMRINKLFFEKFNIGVIDFLNDFLELSNTEKKFISMAEYYISISDKLSKTIFETDYIFPSNLLLEKSLIKGFIAFIKKDKEGITQSIVELKERGNEEFRNGLNNSISFSRENIIKNNKRFLKEKLASLELEGFDLFSKKIDSYSADQLEEFLLYIESYLKNIPEDTQGFEISLFIIGNKVLLKEADKIPYLKDIQEEQKDYKYIPERFYDYIDVDTNVYDLLIFILATNLLCNQKINEAYVLLKVNEIEKTESFDMMFLIGKIFNFFDDKEYKKYFNMVKKIDRDRYKKELEKFLIEKDQKILKL